MASAPTEGLPTAIQEAFACGTPLLATPVSGIPDAVRLGESGFLIEEDDPDHLADRIEEILERDDLPVISENCRQLAVNNYSFEASVERFRELLLGLSGYEDRYE